MPEFSPQQRAFIRKHSKYEEPGADELDDELNIIPFLDIVVNLIMFLLMITSSIAFYSQVEASLPTYSSGGVGRRSTDEPQLNLSVFVTQNGITVTGSGGKLAPGCATTSTGDVLTVAKRGGTYNWEGLTDCVATVKEEFPDETRVTVSADNLVEFQDLISAMDAVRMKDGEELFPEVLISAGVR
jgi:biopolymer transport protein TolR